MSNVQNNRNGHCIAMWAADWSSKNSSGAMMMSYEMHSTDSVSQARRAELFGDITHLVRFRTSSFPVSSPCPSACADARALGEPRVEICLDGAVPALSQTSSRQNGPVPSCEGMRDMRLSCSAALEPSMLPLALLATLWVVPLRAVCLTGA
jgi:hypothetical protein